MKYFNNNNIIKFVLVYWILLIVAQVFFNPFTYSRSVRTITGGFTFQTVIDWGLIFNFAIFIPLVVIVIIKILQWKTKSESNKIRPVSSKISEDKKFKNDGFIFGFARGDESLAKTFWLYFILANVVLNALALVLNDPLYDVNISSFYLIIYVIWNVLAVIGVFNSANIYKAEKIKINESYVWATVSKVATILLILSAIGNSIKYFK